MEYNWDSKDLREHIKKIKHLLKFTEGLTEDEIKAQKRNIMKLKQMINICENKDSFQFNLRDSRINYIDNSKYIPESTYKIFNNISSGIKKTILKSIKYFSDIIEDYQSINLLKLKISDHELVLMAYDFYKWLPDRNLVKYFAKYANPNNHLLRFTNDLDDDLGETIPFYYPYYKPYFSILREKTINDFITLNHEIAHGIFYQNETSVFNKFPHYYFLELEGYFFDYLSIEYLKDKIPKETIQELEFRRINDVFMLIKEFYYIYITIFLFKEKREISSVSVQEKIFQDGFDIEFNYRDMILALNKNPLSIIKYIISYFISLQLEDVYEKDQNEAFKMLAIIRNCNSWKTLKSLNFKILDEDILIDKAKTFYYNKTIIKNNDTERNYEYRRIRNIAKKS